MTPFMAIQPDGKQKVNIIRLVEQALSGAVYGLIILYGGYLVLGEKVDTINAIVKSHVASDMIVQRELQAWRLEQHELIVRHDTILRQEGILK